MTPVQMKMARAALEWDAEALAHKAGVAEAVVSDVERGIDADPATLQALQAALEAAGLEFIPADGTAGPGVRLRTASDTHADLTRRIMAIEEHLARTNPDAPVSPRRGMQQLEDARKRDIGVKLRNRRTKLKKADKP